MRKILGAAVFAAGLSLSGQAVKAEITVELSPKDPKFNSPECKSMREKAKNYKNSLFQQDAGTYVFAAVMPGGTVGFLALQKRKDDMFKRQVEQACLTNPPDRSYLDEPAGR
jgi:hypothetical protein